MHQMKTETPKNSRKYPKTSANLSNSSSRYLREVSKFSVKYLS